MVVVANSVQKILHVTPCLQTDESSSRSSASTNLEQARVEPGIKMDSIIHLRTGLRAHGTLMH